MPNPFDQFDAVPQANPFDKFDEATAPSEKPGILVPSIKRTAGQMVGATGVALEDLGLKTRLPEIGRAVTEAYPAQIQKPSDILEKPGTFLKESVSEMIPQLGVYAAGAWGGAKIGGRLGAFLGPKGAALGAVGGGIVGGLAPIFTQEYGEIREIQKKEGAENIATALAGAGVNTALERAFGLEKYVGKALKAGALDTIKEGVSRPLHMLKRGALGALIEGPGTEFPQTAIERLAGGAPLANEEAIADYIISSAKGAAGGGVISAGLAGLSPRAKQEVAPEVTPEAPPVAEAPTGPAVPEPMGLSEFIRSTRAEAEQAPMGITEFVRSKRPAGDTSPVKAKEVKAAKAEYDAYKQAFLAGQQAEYEAYKQAFINEQFGVQPLTPEQRNQIIINQTPLETQVAEAPVVAEPVQKTRIAEPVILGEQPTPAPAAPIITPQEAEFLRIAEKEAGYAASQVEVQGGVQLERGEGAVGGQAAAAGVGDRVFGAAEGQEGRAPSVKVQVALLKQQKGEPLTVQEQAAVRAYERAAPKVDVQEPVVQTQPKFRGRQFGSAERRENFVNAYSSAVDTALADLTAQGVTATPNKLRRAATLLKRSAEDAVMAKDDAAGAAVLDAAMAKALRGIIPKAEIEVFRQKLADAAQAAMPETLSSRAAVDEVIAAKAANIRNTLAGMIGTPKDVLVETPERVAGGAGMIQFGELRDIIAVSLQAADEGSAAAHEGFHYLEKRVLNGPERRVIRQAFASGSRLHRMLVAKAEAYDAANGTDITSEIRAIPAEARAYGFEFWRRGELEAQGMIAKVFQKLARVMERIRNYIEGLGFTSYEDLFAMIRRGEYAKRDLSGIREFEREVMRSRAQREASEQAFYSALAEAVADIKKVAGKDGMIAPAQAKAWLAARQKEGRFKAAELEAVGLAEWLDLQPGKVAVADIEAFVREHGVRVEETMLGGPKFVDLPREQRAAAVRIIKEYDNLGFETPMEGVYAYAENPDAWDIDVGARAELDEALGGYTRVKEAKFSQWQLPGGENYRELLLRLPGGEKTVDAIARRDAAWTRISEHVGFPRNYHPVAQTRWASENVPQLYAEWQDASRVANNKPTASDMAFRSSHFDQPNILAHVRFNERTDADGKRVLFIEELQSDWAQKGRKEGFGSAPVRYTVRDRNGNIRGDFTTREEAEAYIADPPITMRGLIDNNARVVETANIMPGIPTAPFVTDTKAWVALALKRMIRYAAENGFDRVAWTTGEQQADRYDLSKRIMNVAYSGSNFKAFDHDGNEVISQTGVRPEDLPDLIGKDAAEKLMAQEPQGTLRVLSGQDLKVGGEGMKAFYDKIVPQVANEVLKKFGGGKVGIVNFPKTAQQARWDSEGAQYSAVAAQPGFDITPALKGEAMAGLPLFSKAARLAQPETPEFKRWFGDSKVVDEQGRPLVVYHGTNKDFSKFKDGPVWFHTDPQQAFASGEGANVMPAYVKIERPIRRSGYFGMEDFSDPARFKFFDKAAGQWVTPDGVIGDNGVVVAFSPKQIKSAIGNQGTFDPNDPNILYSKAATESIQDIGRRFSEGELQREQVNAHLMKRLDAPDMRDLTERLFEKGGVELKALGNSIRRFGHAYIFSGLNRARASQGYANVFGVMTHFIQRKAIIFERAIAKDLSTWVKGATKQDKTVVSKAMLEATVKGLARDSAEYHALMQPLTQEQRAMADQAWTMIGKMLDAEFVAEQAKYRKLFADDAKFAEWFENRKVQVEQLKKNSYFPERRYGDHFVHAYVDAPDGKKITVYYEQYEREAGATSAKAELEKIFGAEGLKVEYGFKHKVDYDGSVSIGQFLDLAQRHGIALTQDEKERLGKALIAADSTRRNRLFRRQNVAGYSQDGMRVLAEFAVSMSNKIAYAEMGDALQDALQGRQVDVAFTKEGTVAINTQADTNLWKLDGPDAGFFRNLADEKVGFVMSPDSRSTISNKLRALAVIYFLGGSVAAAGVNLSSLPMITFPWLIQHTTPARAMSTLLEGMRLAGKHFNDIRDLPTLLSQKPLEGIDNVDGLRHALQIGAQDGSLFDTEQYQFMGLSRGQEYSLSGRTQEAVKLWMTPFRLAEQYNRVSAFIAAYKVAKSNNLDNEAAHKQAQEAVFGTQFRYDEANRPALADSGVGSLFFVFKSFPIFMMETMTFLAKTNPKSAVFMLGMLVLMAGVEGLPFAEDLEDLIDVLAQRLFNEPFNSKRWLRNTLKSASEAVVGADLSGVLMHGVANSLTGLNFASRVGAGNLIPGTRIGAADVDYRRAMDEILGPVGGMVSGMVEGADALSKGDFLEAAKKGLPLAAKNAVKGWEQFEKGYATDAGGRKLVDVGSWEAFWQSVGFSSSALAQVYESDTLDRRTTAFYVGIREQFTKEMVSAIRDGDRAAANEVGQAIMAWNQAHPDMPIALSPASLRDRVAKAGMPLSQRTLLTMPKYLRGQSEAAIGLAAE